MRTENRDAEETLLAAAIQWLIEGGSKDDLLAASSLMACNLEIHWVEEGFTVDDRRVEVYELRLIGPRPAVEEINKQEDIETTAFDDDYHKGKKGKPSLGKHIAETFKAIAPPFENMVIDRVYAQGGLSEEITPEWWSSVREYLKTGGVTNQGWYRPDEVKGSTPIVWKFLRFRSLTERKIAEALEAANVLFMPGAKARLEDVDGERIMREPDFLIFHEGTWAILEIDGPLGHSDRAAKDHERDRAFRRYGIQVERYPAERCFQEPESVVAEFLRVISQQ